MIVYAFAHCAFTEIDPVAVFFRIRIPNPPSEYVVDPETGFCIGCGRTRGEIGSWLGMSAEERRDVMGELPERVSTLTRRKTRRGGRAGRFAVNGD